MAVNEMRTKLEVRGRRAIQGWRRVRSGGPPDRVSRLQRRVAVLEDEVQECRQLNLRLAELTDVVQELLLPVAQRDEEKVAAVLEKYADGL